jgi:hypothetical protein
VLISRLLPASCSRRSSSRRSARSSLAAAAAGCTVPAAAAAAGCRMIRHRAGLRRSGRQQRRPPSQTSSRLACVESGDSYHSFRVSLLALKRKPPCLQASDLMHISSVCAHRPLAQTAAASNSAWMLSCQPLLGMVCTPRACHVVARLLTCQITCPQAHGKDWDRLEAAVPGKTRPQIKNYYQVGFGQCVATLSGFSLVCTSLPYFAPAGFGQGLMWFRSHTRCLTSKTSGVSPSLNHRCRCVAAAELQKQAGAGGAARRRQPGAPAGRWRPRG